MTKETILVTGGAGFIGANYIHYMLANNDACRIINFDALTYAGNLENLSSIQDNPRYTFIKGDITRYADLSAVFKDIDYVVHFAAETHVDRSIQDSAVFAQTNVVGTDNLLRIAKERGVKRFVHISTDEVYGSLGQEGLFTEETPLAPRSPYAASKAGADMLVQAFYHTYDFPVVITRCTNNYGPYQFEEKLIPLMIYNALNDKPLPVYGDGLHIRDWLYVDDNCRAIDVIMRKGRDGEVYNIGGNNEWANIDIVKLILKELNKPESLISFVEDRLGHDRRYGVDSAKLKNELGWIPAFRFKEAIVETIVWYVNRFKR